MYINSKAKQKEATINLPRIKIASNMSININTNLNQRCSMFILKTPLKWRFVVCLLY